MIFFGLDTENADDRSNLPSRIEAASPEELRQAANAAKKWLSDLAGSQRLTYFEEITLEMLILQRKILRAEAAQARRRTGRDRARWAMAQPEPTPDSWEQLRILAETLSPRRAGDRPHSPLTHLRQRLGNSQRGKRPPVRARSTTIAPGRFATVGAANFGRLLKAAEDGPWKRLTRKELADLTKYLDDEGRERSVPVGRRYGGPDTLWSRVLVFNGNRGENEEGKRSDDKRYEAVFTPAWQAIVETVEGEVLNAIGLPHVHIYLADPGNFGGRLCYYDESRQTIFFRVEALRPDQILHEFGHHIEEQGPVEIWFQLASMLHWMSGDRNLNPPGLDGTREPSYPLPFLTEKRNGLPGGPYGASYYQDAGTELLAYSMERNALANVDASRGQWLPDMRNQEVTVLGNCEFGPEFILLLLHALRPGQMRAAGFPNPALL